MDSIVHGLRFVNFQSFKSLLFLFDELSIVPDEFFSCDATCFDEIFLNFWF